MADWEGRETQRPLHKETIRVERKQVTNWSWLLLPIVALGLLALMFMPRQDYRTQQARTTTTTTQVATTQNRAITYNKRTWEVRGAAQTFPEGQLKQVGTSDQGDALYANPQQGYGGGGGQGDESTADSNTPAQSNAPVYLRNSDGSFQPLYMQQ